MQRIAVLLLVIVSTSSFAQIGGKNSFEFVNVPSSARLNGMGGVNVSAQDTDVNFFTSNPALVSDSLAGTGSASYQFFVADVGNAAFSYGHRFEKIGAVFFNLQHIGYGTIQGYDASGNQTSVFNSGETALTIGKNVKKGNFRMGANAKLLYSNLAGYQASAVALDLGGVFSHPIEQLTVALAIKNLGIVISDYRASAKSSLPFDVQVGTTFRPENMPLRFSFTAFNLNKPNAVYANPADGSAKPRTSTKIFSHLNFGSEFFIHRHLTIMVAYNYFIHQALMLQRSGGTAGLCYGFAASVKSFDFSVSRGTYVAGRSGYAFTISRNIQNIRTKRRKI